MLADPKNSQRPDISSARLDFKIDYCNLWYEACDQIAEDRADTDGFLRDFEEQLSESYTDNACQLDLIRSKDELLEDYEQRLRVNECALDFYCELWREACDEVSKLRFHFERSQGNLEFVSEEIEYLEHSKYSCSESLRLKEAQIESLQESVSIKASIHEVLVSWYGRLLPYFDRPRDKRGAYRHACDMFRDFADEIGFHCETSAQAMQEAA